MVACSDLVVVDPSSMKERERKGEGDSKRREAHSVFFLAHLLTDCFIGIFLGLQFPKSKMALLLQVT